MDKLASRPLSFLLRFSCNISPDPPFQSHHHGFPHWSCFSIVEQVLGINLSDCPMVPDPENIPRPREQCISQKFWTWVRRLGLTLGHCHLRRGDVIYRTMWE